MSGASCAKIIIDNYGALGGSAEGLYVTAEASCEALMVLIEDHPELEAKALAISAKACKWGDTLAEWKKELETEVRELAEGVLREHGGGREASPNAGPE